MKAKYLPKLPSLTVFAGLILVVPGAVYSQAPPGPLPGAQPQPVPASWPSQRSKLRSRRRAQPSLARGSSIPTIATTRARGHRIREDQEAVALVADVAA